MRKNWTFARALAVSSRQLRKLMCGPVRWPAVPWIGRAWPQPSARQGLLVPPIPSLGLPANTLAILNHELRTPLNAVIGFAGLLRSLRQDPDLADRCEAYCRIIEASGEHILSVLEAALQQALPAGAVPVAQCQPARSVDLCDLAADCALVLTPMATSRAITIRVEQAKRPLKVAGKAHAMRQIVINLMANAVKFSPPGSEVRVAPRRRRDGRIEIVITDRGLGIGSADLAAIGQPYRRGAEAVSRGIEGSGLGLAICQGLAAELGGMLELESRPGAGTTARLVLPATGSCDRRSGSRKRTKARGPARSGTAVNPILAIGAQ